MEEKSVEQFKDLKIQSLKETNRVLEACKKEYQKLYLEHETLQKKFHETTRRISQISKTT